MRSHLHSLAAAAQALISARRARIIGSLGQPLLFLLALGFGFGPTFAKAGGGNYIQFLAPGNHFHGNSVYGGLFAGSKLSGTASSDS